MPKELAIQMRSLGFKIGERHILHDLNWSVFKGEHWVVFGMNGCGKTTLLSLLAGFSRPTTGALEVLGEQFSPDNVFAKRQRIGWVSGSFFEKCYHRETLLHIVLSGCHGTLGLDGTETDEDVRRAKGLLREFGLAEYIDYPFDMLSKGQRQNTLIVRALMPKPELLLLDEPASGLDIYARDRLSQVVEEVAADGGVTMVYVTHYSDEIPQSFEKCLLMREGGVFAQGSLDDLFTAESMREFLGYPVSLEERAGRRFLSVSQQDFEGGVAVWK